MTRHLAILFLFALPQSIAAAQQPAVDEVPDDGFTSEFHRAHAGQIVFASSEIGRRRGPRAPSTTFDVNDTIFLRVYQASSAENLMRRRDGSGCERSYSGFGRRVRMIRARRVGASDWVTIDHGEMGATVWNEDTTFPLTFADDIVPLYDRRPLQVPGPEINPRFVWVHALLPTLSPGANQVEFEAGYQCNMSPVIPVGSATITIRVNPRALADVQRRSRVEFARNQLPANLQRQMRSETARYFGDPWEVTHAIGVGPWTVAYHPINRRPVSRQIDGWAFLRNKQTNTCAVVNTGFEQSARSRSAFRREARSTGVGGGPPKPIACSSVPRR